MPLSGSGKRPKGEDIDWRAVAAAMTGQDAERLRQIEREAHALVVTWKQTPVQEAILPHLYALAEFWSNEGQCPYCGNYVVRLWAHMRECFPRIFKDQQREAKP